jgi:hypothetical protein
MPTLSTSEHPDSYNLDYFYPKYADRYGLVMSEEKTSTLRVLSANLKPDQCDTARKFSFHYFKVPTQPNITSCLCTKYHTSFTSKYFRLPAESLISSSTQLGSSAMDISPLTNKRFNQLKDILPESPSRQTSSIPEARPTILFPSFNTNTTPTEIIGHSQHYHTCVICHIKSVPCIILQKNNQHGPDYTQAILFKNRLIHRTCATKIDEIKLKPSAITKLEKSQKAVRTIYKLTTLKISDKKSLLQKLIDRKKLIQQTKESNNQHEQENQFPKRDITNDLDWFKTHPISSTMEPYIKFNTPLSHQIFDFIKPYLIDFAPGQINKNKPNSKYNFNYLIKNMTGERPKFLTDLIYQHNPSIDRTVTIPFDILLTTFKTLLSKFTKILFTKLNYAKIFSLHSSIPPYTISNRNNIALNLARLHLFLNNTYQTINRTKFIQDLNIRPLRLNLHYYISEDSLKQPLLKIQNDEKFNINISLNIPKKQFLQTFRIPSLKNNLIDFDNWFKLFFEKYKRQFTQINEKKVYNFLKHQIATKLSDTCKQLLPQSFNITAISSLRERSLLCTKAALYHIHTCTHNTENLCSTLPSDTEHNYKNLATYFFHQSFDKFPVPPNTKTKEKWIHPDLDYSIFNLNNKYSATFKNPTPTDLFRKLASEAEAQFISANNTDTNPKRSNYYFYCYFKAYLQAAAENDGIKNCSQYQAIQKITSNLVDTHFLARVLTYFFILENNQILFSQIRHEYNTKLFPQAEEILFGKFQINFSSLELIQDTTLFDETTPILSKSQNSQKQTEIPSYSSLLSQTPKSISQNPFQ